MTEKRRRGAKRVRPGELMKRECGARTPPARRRVFTAVRRPAVAFTLLAPFSRPAVVFRRRVRRDTTRRFKRVVSRRRRRRRRLDKQTRKTCGDDVFDKNIMTSRVFGPTRVFFIYLFCGFTLSVLCFDQHPSCVPSGTARRVRSLYNVNELFTTSVMICSRIYF